MFPTILATTAPGWPTGSAVLCSWQGDTSGTFDLEGKAWVFRQPALCFSSVTVKSHGVKDMRICPEGPACTCAADCSRGLVTRNDVRMEWIYPGHKRRLAKKTKMSFKINCTS